MTEKVSLKRCPSPAKLNLFLSITGRRPDGYHNLQTLFQFIDFCDYLEFERRNDGKIVLETPVGGVENSKNLIVIAAKTLQEKTNTRYGVTINIEKNIPSGSGLGGASSNAATTLVALSRLWDCHISSEELMRIGKKIGADVPVFIFGHAAFAEGIGEILQKVSPPEKWYLVINPGISISTAAIFNDPKLHRHSPVRSVTDFLSSPFKNDCEKIVRNHFPVVEHWLDWLLQYAPARLTGTGACVFAEFETEREARDVMKKLPDVVQAIVVQGKNISPLQTFLAGSAFKA